jgi:hypothetical protein
MHIGSDPGEHGVGAVLARKGTLEGLHNTPTLTRRTREDRECPG